MSRVGLAQRSCRVLMGSLLAALAGAAVAVDRPVGAAAALATEVADAGSQHQAIAAERAALERRFSADRLHCQQLFQVSDCLARVSAERRQALQKLQQQTLQLDDAKRRQKAAQRLQLQQEHQTELAARAARQAPVAESGREPKASSEAASDSPVRVVKPAVQPAVGQDELKLREQRRRARHDGRQAAAKAHQQALEERNANPLHKRPKATALPVPAASAITP